MGASNSRFLRETLNDLIVDPSSVVETKENLGTGSYGEVVVVRVNGLRCACKKLHEALTSTVTRENIVVHRFVKECETMSKLQHPHIVQFLGVHFGQSSIPSLIMELLPTNLGNFLEKYGNVPSYVKHSVLFDVSLGLLYLHLYKPPIIHRDLTVNNILLTRSLKAKISDLGVARTLNFTHTQRQSPAMSICPGTQSAMPPEAFGAHPKYDAKLDIFSFGHIVIHVAIQRWPLPLEEKYLDPVTNEDCHRTEIERREEYILAMGCDNPLHNLAVSCLQNDPTQRPTTKKLVEKMEEIYTKTPPPYSNLMEAIQKIDDLSARVKDLNCQIEEKNSALQKLENQVEAEKFIAQLAAAGRPIVETPENELPSQITQTFQFPSQTTPPISKPRATPEREASTAPLQIANHEPSPPIPKPRATTPERQAPITPLQNHEPSPPVPKPRATTPERGAPMTPLHIANHEPTPPVSTPGPLATIVEREVPTQPFPISNHEPTPPISNPRPLAITPEREAPTQLLPTPPVTNPRPLAITPEREAPTQLLPTPLVTKPRTKTPEREVLTQPIQPVQIPNHEPVPRGRLATAPSSSSQHRTSQSKNWARIEKRNSLLLGESRDPKLLELLEKQKKKIQDNKSGEGYRKLEATQRKKYANESHTLPRSKTASGREPTAELQQWLERRRKISEV